MDHRASKRNLLLVNQKTESNRSTFSEIVMQSINPMQFAAGLKN
jgi:hypothetical protein